MELNQFRNVDVVLDKANDNIIQKQFVSAGDKDGRSLTVQITENGVIGEIIGAAMNLYWHNQASGLTDLSAFYVVDRATSVFKIDYPQNMLTPGKVIAYIQILHGGKVTHTKPFEITVQKLAGTTRGVLATAEYGALVTTLAKANEFETDIAVLDNKKAEKTALNATNNTVNNLQVNKVDKGGNEQVTMGMLAQSVKEAMTGGSVAVVGVGGVNVTNIVDKAVTENKRTEIGNAISITTNYDGDSITYDKLTNIIKIPADSLIKTSKKTYVTTNVTNLDVAPTNPNLAGSSLFAVWFDTNVNTFIVQKYQWVPPESYVLVAIGRNTLLGKVFASFPLVVKNAPVEKTEIINNKAEFYDSFDLYANGYYASQANGALLKPILQGTGNRLILKQSIVAIDDGVTRLFVSTNSDISLYIYPIDANGNQLSQYGWLTGFFKTVVLPAGTKGFAITVKNDADILKPSDLKCSDIFISTDKKPLKNILEHQVDAIAQSQSTDKILNKMQTTYDLSNLMLANLASSTGSVSAIDPLSKSVIRLRESSTATYVFPVTENKFFEYEFYCKPSSSGLGQSVKIEFDVGRHPTYDGGGNQQVQTISLDSQYGKVYKLRMLAPLYATKVTLTFSGATNVGPRTTDISQLKVRLKDTIFDGGHPKLIAHRGAPWTTPENTMPAYQNAVNLGFKYLEADLAVTNDDKWLLSHDYTIDRCADGSGNITTHNELWAKGFDFGIRADNRFKNTTIPDFEEFVRFCKTTGSIAVMEFKNAKVGQPLDSLVAIVNKYQAHDDIVFISFDQESLLNLRNVFGPKVKLAVLASTFSTEILTFTESLGNAFLNCGPDLTVENVTEAHELGVEIGVWTLNHQTDYIKFVEMNVDYITTDHLNLSGCVY